MRKNKEYYFKLIELWCKVIISHNVKLWTTEELNTHYNINVSVSLKFEELLLYSICKGIIVLLMEF